MTTDDFLDDLHAGLATAQTKRAQQQAELEPLRARIEERVLEIAKKIDPMNTTLIGTEMSALGKIVHLDVNEKGHAELSIQAPEEERALAILTTIAGAGMAKHPDVAFKSPIMSREGVIFDSVDHLLLCLNALAKDQSQKIDLPDRGQSPA